MKLVILGANGRTGALVLKQALEKGAEVTAVVRSPEKRPALEAEKLKVIVGDPCNAAFLRRAFRDQDAVISTLGGRSPTRKATAVYYRSADAIVAAALDTGVKRLAVTSSALLFPPRSVTDRVLALLVGNVVRSARRMEATLSQSGLDVVIARCGFLTDAPETGYRAERDQLPENGSSISRHGLARFLLDAIDAHPGGFQVFGVSRPA